MKPVVKISDDGGVTYKDLVSWEIELPPVEPIPQVFKFLGEHYGFLIFISNQGDTFVFKQNGDNSFLKVGEEYELRQEINRNDNKTTFSHQFTSSGLE